MVCRLVQEQQPRAPQQQLGECDPHLPATRECLAWMVEVFTLKTETPKHRGDFGLDVVSAPVSEGLLHIAVAFEHLIVFGGGDFRIAESSFEVTHLPLNGKHVIEGFTGFFEEGAAAMRQALLREIPNGQTAGPRDHACVGLIESGHHAKQCRLAGAVRTAQSDSVARLDLPGRRVEEDVCAERLSNR